MKKLSMTLVLVFLLCNLSGLAQDLEEEERDILEVVLSGGAAIPVGGISDWVSAGADWTSADRPKIAAKTGIEIGFELGAFINPNTVLGLGFIYSQYTLDTEEDAGNLKHRFYNPNLYLKYYFFGESDYVPYVKVHAGVDNPKFTTQVMDKNDDIKLRELSYNPVLSFGIGGGLLYYTADYSGLFIEAGYHYGFSDETTKSYDDIEYTFGENTGIFDIKFGVKVFFGSDE